MASPAWSGCSTQRLRDPAQRGKPVALSIDSRVQAIARIRARQRGHLDGAPTAAPASSSTSRPARWSPWPRRRPSTPMPPAAPTRARCFNRATMGVYELGSTFKPITVAAAMEAGVVTSMHQRWDAPRRSMSAASQIHDDDPHAAACSTSPRSSSISSNIAAAQIADAMGAERMHGGVPRAGLRPRAADRAARARRGRSGRATGAGLTVMTSGFGHGIAITPLHLATAYAALVNGGIWRPATLLRVAPGHQASGRRRLHRGDQLPDAPAAAPHRPAGHRPQGRRRRASASAARPAPPRKRPRGGYNRHANVSTFAAAFPMDAPRYVVLVMLDDPRPTAANSGVTTAAWTAAPVVGRVDPARRAAARHHARHEPRHRHRRSDAAAWPPANRGSD